eukprot:gnl/TRDRNA2_/TRDRNA2_103174_c2_seq1.p1 gnl/TRDRNA2_/TRDRNA2_103174_c2~~gnl/TRDRNA2_/TRDRNA2_103174_c2_seq1.p1  ORF type:complete len:139 (-),score=3.11 gnl/TRDRNA2_/TRDRNA2_103174_c2_seq1:106-522(-)
MTEQVAGVLCDQNLSDPSIGVTGLCSNYQLTRSRRNTQGPRFSPRTLLCFFEPSCSVLIAKGKSPGLRSCLASNGSSARQLFNFFVMLISGRGHCFQSSRSTNRRPLVKWCGSAHVFSFAFIFLCCCLLFVGSFQAAS